MYIFLRFKFFVQFLLFVGFFFCCTQFEVNSSCEFFHFKRSLKNTNDYLHKRDLLREGVKIVELFEEEEVVKKWKRFICCWEIFDCTVIFSNCAKSKFVSPMEDLHVNRNEERKVNRPKIRQHQQYKSLQLHKRDPFELYLVASNCVPLSRSNP